MTLARLRSIAFWRRLIQTGVLLAFVFIPLANKAGLHALSGNFLSFNAAGLPLADPLACLQVFAGVFSGTSSMLVGAGLVLLLALLLGPVFCAWICPYGLLSELTSAAFRKAPPPKEAEKRKKVITARPFGLKLLIVCLGLAGIVLFAPMPLLNQLSMPGWYSRLMQHAVLYGQILWGGVALIGLVLLAEGVAGKRLWCRWLCPQSVLISLAGNILPQRLQVRFTRKACTCPASDRPCLAACSLALNPRKITTAQSLQCTNCGDCIEACSLRGKALDFGFGKKE